MSNYKYIDKYVNKSGKTVYVYDDPVKRASGPHSYEDPMKKRAASGGTLFTFDDPMRKKAAARTQDRAEQIRRSKISSRSEESSTESTPSSAPKSTTPLEAYIGKKAHSYQYKKNKTMLEENRARARAEAWKIQEDVAASNKRASQHGAQYMHDVARNRKIKYPNETTSQAVIGRLREIRGLGKSDSFTAGNRKIISDSAKYDAKIADRKAESENRKHKALKAEYAREIAEEKNKRESRYAKVVAHKNDKMVQLKNLARAVRSFLGW